MLVIVAISYIQVKGEDDEKGIPLTGELFDTVAGFNVAAFTIMIRLAVLYSLFW